MLEFLAKAIPVFLITITVPILIGLILVGFDLARKRYTENDYTIRQIIVRKCLTSNSGDGIIIAADNDSEYLFNRSLLRSVGSAPELADRLCHQRELKLWLNPENEISAFKGADFSIPIEIGIVRDDSKHDFLALGLSLSILCSLIMIIFFLHNKRIEKIRGRGRIHF